MATIDEIRKTRLKKLNAIESAGFLAYPAKTERTHTCKQAFDSFSKLSRSKKEIYLTGRIIALRQHGGLTFCHIKDGESQIQISLKKDGLGEKGYSFFLENFDIGDFIEVRGILFKTKRGEKTLEVSDYKILAKSLLPLPEKWHGLQDIEERYRKRYLDLIFNPEVKEKFKLRSKIISEIRAFLEKEGFLNLTLQWLKLTSEPIAFLNSIFAIMIMMVYYYLPFMLLPIYSSLERFDVKLLEASYDLGASWFKTLYKIQLPLCSRAIKTGFFLVFIPSFGEFAIPELMGGDRWMFVGNAVSQFILGDETGSLGAAFTVLSCVCLLICACLLYLLVDWLLKPRRAKW